MMNPDLEAFIAELYSGMAVASALGETLGELVEALARRPESLVEVRAVCHQVDASPASLTVKLSASTEPSQFGRDLLAALRAINEDLDRVRGLLEAHGSFSLVDGSDSPGEPESPVPSNRGAGEEGPP